MKNLESKVNKQDERANSLGRRKFLTRSSAGLVIASLPASSVWANTIAGSIVASGHSSDWATRNEIGLQSHGRFLNSYDHSDPIFSKDFEDFFGAMVGGTFTLLDAIRPANGPKANPSAPSVARNYRQHVTIVLNAYFDDIDGSIDYPVLDNYMGATRLIKAEAFAKDVYAAGASDGLLGDMIDCHHFGGEASATACDNLGYGD